MGAYILMQFLSPGPQPEKYKGIRFALRSSYRINDIIDRDTVSIVKTHTYTLLSHMFLSIIDFY